MEAYRLMYQPNQKLLSYWKGRWQHLKKAPIALIVKPAQWTLTNFLYIYQLEACSRVVTTVNL